MVLSTCWLKSELCIIFMSFEGIVDWFVVVVNQHIGLFYCSVGKKKKDL